MDIKLQSYVVDEVAAVACSRSCSCRCRVVARAVVDVRIDRSTRRDGKCRLCP